MRAIALSHLLGKICVQHTLCSKVSFSKKKCVLAFSSFSISTPCIYHVGLAYVNFQHPTQRVTNLCHAKYAVVQFIIACLKETSF